MIPFYTSQFNAATLLRADHLLQPLSLLSCNLETDMAKTRDVLKPDLQPDSVEWCPNQTFQRCLAVGSYQLDEATQNRFGKYAALQVAIQ